MDRGVGSMLFKGRHDDQRLRFSSTDFWGKGFELSYSEKWIKLVAEDKRIGDNARMRFEIWIMIVGS